MKITKDIISILVVFLMALFSLSVVAIENERTNSDPKIVVESFYKEYLSSFNDADIGVSLRKAQSAIDAYTTKHLQQMKENDDSDSDYFIAAQDICPSWLEHILIKNIEVKSNTATLNLELGEDNNKSLYKIRLIKNKRGWLMNSVEFGARTSEICNQ